MIAVIVQPEDHCRGLRNLYQQVAESTQSVLTEDGNLAGQFRRIVDLGVAGGEKLMPEEGHLFFQGPPGVDHAVNPVGLIDGRRASPLIARKVTIEQFLVYGWLPLRVKKLLDHGFVAFGGTLLQDLAQVSEACASHQVGHQSNVFLVGHYEFSAGRSRSGQALAHQGHLRFGPVDCQQRIRRGRRWEDGDAIPQHTAAGGAAARDGKTAMTRMRPSKTRAGRWLATAQASTGRA